MATSKNETTEVVTEQKSISVLLREFAAKIKETVMSGNDIEIVKLRDDVLFLRTMLMSGGKFTLTNGTKADCGLPVGITSLFDDCVSFAQKNGMTEVETIIDRSSKRGPKSTEVVEYVSSSI